MFKGIHKNATTIIILNGETLNALCLRGKQYKDTRIGIIIISLNTMLEILVSAFRQGIEAKDYKDKNWSYDIYIENAKESTDKLLQIIG